MNMCCFYALLVNNFRNTIVYSITLTARVAVPLILKHKSLFNHTYTRARFAVPLILKHNSLLNHTYTTARVAVPLIKNVASL